MAEQPSPHDSPPQPTAARRRSRRWRLWLGALVVVASAAGFAAWWFRPPSPSAPADPRLTFETPFQNVRPHVKYVGDDNCIWCHGDISTTYAEHSMGQSCFPIAEATAVEKIGKTARFESMGFEYTVERTPGGFKHHQRLRDAKGNELFHIAHDVVVAVGSGSRGRSYLLQHGNQLFQSPISWYSHTSQWDIAPGYTKNNWHFERLIPPRCVYCHANQTVPVPGTNNRYEPPLFRGHAIGCERCHGPGELHVARQEGGETYAGPDDTIVNPARLSATLRDDVCAQCHLQGEERVLRRGRDQYDFRPGMPLALFEVVFVRHPDLVDYQKSVGQFEQLAVSACRKKSGGALGCVSCHDPHFKPSPAEAPAHFRARCEKCHAGPGVDQGTGGKHLGQAGKSAGCSIPLAERQAKNDNSCIACHMPRGDSSNIAHTSVTDHRIVRRPQPAAKTTAKTASRKLLPWELPVVPFHQGRLADDPDLERDIGVVLAGLAELHKSNVPALQAHKRLHQALERHPDDLPAREAFGTSLLWQGRNAEAAEQFAKVLAREPQRESALLQAAVCAALQGNADEELPLLKKLIDANPHYSFYWIRLADVQAAKNDWPAARSAAEQALKLNPAAPEARRTLIQALVRGGEVEQARRHFAIYEALGGKDAATMRGSLER